MNGPGSSSMVVHHRATANRTSAPPTPPHKLEPTPRPMHTSAPGVDAAYAQQTLGKDRGYESQKPAPFVCCYVHGCLSSHAEWTLRQQGNIVPVRSAGPLNPSPLACTAASRCQDPQGRWQRPTRPLRFASGSRWCFCAGNGTACVRQPQLAEASTRAQGLTRVCVCASRRRGRGVLCVLPLTFYGLFIPPSPVMSLRVAEGRRTVV